MRWGRRVGGSQGRPRLGTSPWGSPRFQRAASRKLLSPFLVLVVGSSDRRFPITCERWGRPEGAALSEPPTWRNWTQGSVTRLPVESLGEKGPGLRTQGSTFFRKKFLPDFLSPLLVRTPRWRMYRLMALTTAALWGGHGRDTIRGRVHRSPTAFPPHSLPTLTPHPLPAACLRKGERAPGTGPETLLHPGPHTPSASSPGPGD